MPNKCPHCGQGMSEKLYKVTAGYYQTSDYFVLATSENEAEEVVRKQVRQVVHPEADVTGIEVTDLLR